MRQIGLILLLLTVEPLERVGRLDEPEIREASGIVLSRQYPGVYWVHNDSKNPATLFAVGPDGKLIRSYRVEAPNIDWEDIATDDKGHLYLGDIGNNDNRLPIRAIYRLDEPDPSKPGNDSLKVTLATYYKFAPAHRFDAEGLFVEGTSAYVVSKRFDGKSANLYRIPLDPPAPLLRPAVPEKVATLEGCDEPATGASLSADGKQLAVVTVRAARVYSKVGKDWKRIATIPFDAPDVEAICWDGDDLRLASEDRSLYRISKARWDSGR